MSENHANYQKARALAMMIMGKPTEKISLSTQQRWRRAYYAGELKHLENLVEMILASAIKEELMSDKELRAQVRNMTKASIAKLARFLEDGEVSFGELAHIVKLFMRGF